MNKFVCCWTLFTCMIVFIHYFIIPIFIWLTLLYSYSGFQVDHHVHVHSKRKSGIFMLDDTTDGLIKDRLYRFIEMKSRPPYVGIPRNRLNLPFAVQLMRSSYNSVDELDFVPMDIFQKTFFLFRQSEWEDYKDYHKSILQGDLADPLYFDFISFCQYAVISQKMKIGLYEFTERVGAEGEVQRVTRNNMILNENLPTIHSERVGTTLLEYAIETYKPVSSLQSLPVGSKDLSRFEVAAQDLLDIFTINSFAVDMKLTAIDPNRQMKDDFIYRMSMKAPANLWSQQVLRYRKDNPINDFENKIISALANRLGFKYEVLSTSVSNSIDISHIIRISI